ncbi:MAG: hypothetical protein ACFB4I_09295 [Cyanophyceae cyanobacterium]
MDKDKQAKIAEHAYTIAAILYISQIKQEKLLQQQKEGAIQRAKRDRSLADDWLALEEEA